MLESAVPTRSSGDYLLAEWLCVTAPSLPTMGTAGLDSQVAEVSAAAVTADGY